MSLVAANQRQVVQKLPWRTMGLYLLTFWVVLTFNFFIPRLMPGDPILALLDPNSGDYLYDERMRQEIEA